MPIEVAAHNEWSMQRCPQGERAANDAEGINDEDEDRIETGDGATSHAALQIEEGEGEPRTSTPLWT